jgi:hypothetical protein
LGDKRIAILQSNYLPWKGYLDIIGLVDEFILYDDVQYTRRDWRNRNRIVTPAGIQWLTIPVKVKGRYVQKINETEVSDPLWAQNHWKTIRHAYNHAPFFAQYRDRFEELYLDIKQEMLSIINKTFLTLLCDLFAIKTSLIWSSAYDLADGRVERLIGLCEAAGANVYLSGPAARDYLDENLFRAKGIAVEWMDYSGYPEYPQLHGYPFDHKVSAIDLLFNVGPDARKHLKSHRRR